MYGHWPVYCFHFEAMYLPCPRCIQPFGDAIPHLPSMHLASTIPLARYAIWVISCETLQDLEESTIEFVVDCSFLAVLLEPHVNANCYG